MNCKTFSVLGVTFVMVMIIFNLMLGETVSASTKTIKQEPSYDFQNSPFGFHPAVPYEDANYIGVKWTRGGIILMRPETAKQFR